MTEALKIQLDNVTRELQALQVENSRLREANPELASGIECRTQGTGRVATKLVRQPGV